MDRETLFCLYPIIGFMFAIYLVFTDRLGDGTPLSGKGGAFVMSMWLWPIFLLAIVHERIKGRSKK